MPHLSRNKLNKRMEEELIRTLELVFVKLTKTEDIKEFLLALLTPTERLMLAKRLAMIVLLKENLPESRIAEILHITRGTVARMQLFFEARGQGYEIALRVLENEKLMKEIKEVLFKLAGYSVRAAGGRVKPNIF